MFASPDEFPADDGAGIAEDWRARILRRMLYPALALAAAGMIAWLGGCKGSGPERDLESWLFPNHGPLREARDGDKEFYVTQPRDGVLNLSGRGYLSTEQDVGPDFTLVYEYRFPNAALVPEADRPSHNTGCLLFITGEDKVWPRCLEVQGKWSETASIKSNARDVQVASTLDEPARDAARKPPGAWNRVEIVSRGGALTVSLNGVEVATSEPTELTRGRIGFQAEGFPVEFRDVRIQE